MWFAGIGAALAALLLAGAAVFWWQGRGPTAEAQVQLAQRQLDQGQPVAAVINAKNALAGDAESPALRLLLARALLAAGDLQGASEEADRAGRLGAAAAQVLPLQARIALARQQPGQAIELLREQRFDDARAQAQARTVLAQAHADAGDVMAAGLALADALQADAGHLPARLLQVRLLAAEGKRAAALTQQEALQAQWPQEATVHLLRADLLAGEDDARAAAAYREALALTPWLDRAHMGLVMALLRQRQFDAATTQVATMRKHLPRLPVVDFLDGLTGFLAGRHREAAERLEEVLKRGQPNAAALQLAGTLQARLGQRARAEGLLSSALAMAPGLVDARQELAVLHLKDGRPERAVQALEPVLKPTLQDAQVWRTAGQAYAQLGQFAQADDAFGRATRADPDNAEVRREIARGQIARGQVDAALRGLESAAQADPQGISADLALVSAQIQRGNWAAASQALDGAARKQPQSAMPWLLRGAMADKQGNRAGARSAYEQALAREPRSLRAVWALVGLDVAEQRFDAARSRLQAAVKLEPASAPLRLALADVALRSGATPQVINQAIDASVQADPQDANNWVQALELQRRLGYAPAVLARAQAARAAVPDDATLMLELAGAQLAMANREQALITLQQLVQLRPTLPEAQLRLATVLGLNGQTAQARAPLARALELAPDSPAVLRGAIAMALADRQPARALELARSLQSKWPRQPGGWQLEAEVHEALNNRQAAIAAWRAALDKGALGEAAAALHRQLAAGDGAAAAAFEKRWRATQAQDVYFITYLAETAARAGRRDEAVGLYRQALALAPQHVGVMNNLAELLLSDRQAEALTLATRASRFAPAEPAVLDTLAAAQAAGGQLDAALLSQQRAVAFAPGELQLRLHLGRLWLQKGDKAQAREQLQRAERSTDVRVRDEATRLLGQAS